MFQCAATPSESPKGLADLCLAAMKTSVLGMQESHKNPFGSPLSPGASAAPITRPPGMPAAQTNAAQGERSGPCRQAQILLASANGSWQLCL